MILDSLQTQERCFGTEAPALKQHGLHPLEEAGVISRE